MHPTTRGWTEHPVSLGLGKRMGGGRGNAAKQDHKNLGRVKTQATPQPRAGVRGLKLETGSGFSGHEGKAKAHTCLVCECVYACVLWESWGGEAQMISLS